MLARRETAVVRRAGELGCVARGRGRCGGIRRRGLRGVVSPVERLMAAVSVAHSWFSAMDIVRVCLVS